MYEIDYITIIATANYLKRNVVVMNLSLLSRSDFGKAMRDPMIKKSIIVFDEFDTIIDSLKKSNEEKSNAISDIYNLSNQEERKMILNSLKDIKSDKLDMGFILSILDGIEDATDRIIIATTNRISNIDPLILRPGRFDIKLSLGACSSKMYADIISSFYDSFDDDITREKISSYNITPFKFTPVEVINCALRSKSMTECLEKLSAKE